MRICDNAEMQTALVVLSGTYGWQILREFMQQHIADDTKRLQRIDANDVATIAKLQGEIKALELVINKVPLPKQEG